MENFICHVALAITWDVLWLGNLSALIWQRIKDSCITRLALHTHFCLQGMYSKGSTAMWAEKDSSRLRTFWCWNECAWLTWHVHGIPRPCWAISLVCNISDTLKTTMASWITSWLLFSGLPIAIPAIPLMWTQQMFHKTPSKTHATMGKRILYNTS